MAPSRRLAPYLGLLAAACGPPEADTAVVLTIELDESVEARAAGVDSTGLSPYGGPHSLEPSALPVHLALVAPEYDERYAFQQEFRVTQPGTSPGAVEELVTHRVRGRFEPGRIPWVRVRLWNDGCTQAAQQACERLGGRICCQGRCQPPPELSGFPEWRGERPEEPFPEEALWCPPLRRGDDPVVQLDAGYGAYCAVTEQGGVLCWGAITWPGDTVGVTSGLPRRVPLPDGTKAAQVAVGFGFACALLERDGGARSAWCWGSNAAGQLGVAPPASGPATGEPDLSGASGTLVAVDAGLQFACVLTDAGEVWCWGDNGRGQVGVAPAAGYVTGSATAPHPSPVRVPFRDDDGVRVHQITLGGIHACVLADWSGGQGTVWCWGGRELGQLGDGDTGASGDSGRAEPRRLPEYVARDGLRQLRDVRMLASGFATSCAWVEGTIVCWGLWPAGPTQLAQPTPRFLNVTGAGSPSWSVQLGEAMRISVGGGTQAASGGAPPTFWATVCVRGERGAVGCLGSSDRGQLGPFSPGSGFVQAWHPVAWGQAEAVAAGAADGCLLFRWGQVACWGDERLGQLGRGRLGPDPQPLPEPIAAPAGS